MTTEQKTIALIAHDGKKADMVAFAMDYREMLANYHILATGHTGQLLIEKVGLEVEAQLSGPLGGDAQIGSKVAEGKIVAVLFFIDALGKHPHDPDIQMLMRICNVHNVPLATNPATATAIFKGIASVD